MLHTRNGELEQCSATTLTVSLTSVLSVLVIGLISLLVYKLCIEVHDRRQYAQFKKAEALNMQFAINQNASELYKSPITTTLNPMYGKG